MTMGMHARCAGGRMVEGGRSLQMRRIVWAVLSAALLSAPAALAESAGDVLYLYGYIDADGDRPGETGYDGEPFHPMRLDNVSPTSGNPNATDFNRGMSGFKAALEEKNFSVSQKADSQITLTADALSGVDVLILGSNNRRFSNDEADALSDWVHAGGGLVAWSDSAFGGDFQQVGVGNPTGSLSNNDLTEQFGMTFLRDNGKDFSGPAAKTTGEGITQWEAPHPINNNETDGFAEDGIVFYGEGVSFVRIDPDSDAVILAKPQNGSLDVDSADEPFNADTDAALAINEVGDGRVVGVFDRNLFWNNGEGTDLFEVDNRALAQNVVAYAAIPEPASLGLMGLGLFGGLMLVGRRRHG